MLRLSTRAVSSEARLQRNIQCNWYPGKRQTTGEEGAGAGGRADSRRPAELIGSGQSREATMGWARMLFLGDVGQQMDIGEQQAALDLLRAQAAAQRRQFERADHELDALRQENDELKVSLAALIRILTAKNLLTDAEVRTVVAASEPKSGA